MQDQGAIQDKIRSIVVTRQTIFDDNTRIAANKEDLIQEMQEKYPFFSRFEIENTFEQLKMQEHLKAQQQEGSEIFVFTEGFIAGEEN